MRVEQCWHTVKGGLCVCGPQMPHSAFSGQTPDEMYFGTAVDLPAQLAAARIKTRVERLAANRAMTCDQCSGHQASLPASPIPP